MRAGFDRIGREVSEQQARRGCFEKRRFATRNQARDRAAQLAKKPQTPPLFHYRCNLCHGFHLTSTKPVDYAAHKRMIQASEPTKPPPQIDPKHWNRKDR
jgi:hypothetical protein